jgi:hypothetical protein
MDVRDIQDVLNDSIVGLESRGGNGTSLWVTAQ